MNFAVVILAAGASTRMGRPKLLLPWGDRTVLAHLVATWRELGARQIAVVIARRAGVPPAPVAQRPVSIGACGAGQAERLPYMEEREKAARHPLAVELAGLGVHDRIENPQPQLGMLSSVRCAAQWPGWQPGLTHWLLTLGDQPHAQTATLRALVEFAAQNPAKVCQPARQGRPRHPVMLPRDLFGGLASAPAANLKQFLMDRADQRVCFESEDAGLDFDLDEPADYERALRDLNLRPGRPGCS